MKTTKKTQTLLRYISFTACWALLSACGKSSDSSSSSGGGSGTACVGVGSPALTLQVDGSTSNATWTTINANSTYVDQTANSVFNVRDNCPGGTDADFTFRLVNNGTGCLTEAGTAVTLNKAAPGSPSGVTTSFAIIDEPELPLAPGATTDFTVRLTSTSSCSLSDGVFGGPWNGYTTDRVQIVISTNDPTNPTYNANVDVWGQS